MSKLLTIKEVAEILGVHAATVARWKKEDKPVPYLQVGRQIRFEIEKVIQWLEDKKEKENK